METMNIQEYTGCGKFWDDVPEYIWIEENTDRAQDSRIMGARPEPVE